MDSITNLTLNIKNTRSASYLSTLTPTFIASNYGFRVYETFGQPVVVDSQRRSIFSYALTPSASNGVYISSMFFTLSSAQFLITGAAAQLQAAFLQFQITLPGEILYTGYIPLVFQPVAGVSVMLCNLAGPYSNAFYYDTNINYLNASYVFTPVVQLVGGTLTNGAFILTSTGVFDFTITENIGDSTTQYSTFLTKKSTDKQDKPVCSCQVTPGLP
jgi:hypothetical protein